MEFNSSMLNSSEEQPSSDQKNQPSLSRKILIIDDNEDIRESLSLLLDALGHKVEVAHNGLVGLEKARDFRPECVFCDIALPEYNGYQVAEAFRGDPTLNSIYLVALSGYVQPEKIDQALQAGFDIHLAKPPKFGLLKDILYNLKTE